MASLYNYYWLYRIAKNKCLREEVTAIDLGFDELRFVVFALLCYNTET